jgi:serine/threonine protein phosphatase PrpC
MYNTYGYHVYLENTEAGTNDSILNEDDIDIKIFQIRTHSCIKRRTSVMGEEGQEALFGQFNFNINMTRSIGDKYGPRSCIPYPDVSLLTIQKNERTRIILATDGVWDILGNDDIATYIMKYQDPQNMADCIARHAQEQRRVKQMRRDDITVIVVDINNPHQAQVDYCCKNNCNIS